MTRAVLSNLGVWMMLAGLAADLATAQAVDGARARPARFDDPARFERLSAAFPEIDRLFHAFGTDAHVPGMAWGVVVDGRLVHQGVMGRRDVASEAPVDRQSVFRIASMTKSFTALAVLKLRDDGKLSLDDPAERYVPELAGLAYPTADAPRITIRHLLTHSAGFPEDNPWGDQQLAISDDAMTALLRQGLPFSNGPGLAYEYSNFGFAILGRIVSLTSGLPYRDYVQRSILAPLGMQSTTLEPADVPPDRLTLGYRWEDATWKLEPALADGAFGAMGGMLTSIDDLGRFVGFMLSAWPPRDDEDAGPVRRASVREMQQVWRMRPAVVSGGGPDAPVRLSAGGYGYGLRVTQSCDADHIVAHAGGLPGYGSLMLWLPEHGVGLVAAGNLTYTSWGPRFDAALAALAATGGLRPRMPQPSPALTSARSAVSQLVTAWDDPLADQIAADNLYLDRSKSRRRQEFEALRERHGACRADLPMDVENALRGAWTMSCERGAVRVAITLSPTVPPRVQYLSAVSVAAASAQAPARACPAGQ